MRFSSSYIWAALIASITIIWMFSDNLINIFVGEQKATIEDITEDTTNKDFQNNSLVVSAIEVKNESVPIYFRSSGITKSIFDIQITARREGLIENIYAVDGSLINKGDIIITLDKGTLEQELNAAKATLFAEENELDFIERKFQVGGSHSKNIKSARAAVSRSKKDFESSKRLKEKGITTELELEEKYANYKSAEAALSEILEISKNQEISQISASIQKINADIAKLEKQLEFTEIRSPRLGWIENVRVDIGEFINNGTNIARLIGLNELIFEMQIPQANISNVKLGDQVEINFNKEKYFSGKVHKIGAIANESTRTFNIEVRIQNSDSTLRAGMSAEAQIKISQVDAFKISPAHLNTDDNGGLYVKVIGLDKRVEERAINIVKTRDNFAYISGLANKTIVLTTGQAFLHSGDTPTYKISEDGS